MNSPHIVVSHVVQISEQTFEGFLSTVNSEGLDLQIEVRDEEGLYAGIEWLLPTAVVVYLGKSYFDAFLKEMGKDHYILLKKGLNRLRERFFGLAAPRVTLIGTRGKAMEGQVYSHTFSVLAEARPREFFKLLIQSEVTQDEYEAIIDSFLSFLDSYHGGSLPPEFIDQLEESRVIGRTRLFAFDLKAKVLKPIDPVPDQSKPDS